jgi:RNase H-like domain found in reverse transcriptase
MIPIELNYKIYNKKLLVIIKVFRNWRVSLEGSKYPIKVYIDYKNLLYFTIIKVLN